MNSFYSIDELSELGFKAMGENVRLSKKASFYGAQNISIGNHVRIDDFCIISGNVEIGSFVHISPYTGLFGGEAGIVMEDFVTISSRSVVYAATDDYSGEFMTNPTILDEYRYVKESRVNIGKHVIIGTGCTVLPGVNIGEGAAVGAMSLVLRDIEPWSMNKGIPCSKYKERSRKLLELEQEFIKRKSSIDGRE